MNLSDAIKSRRSIRRYKQKPVDDKLLAELIDSARLAPSGGNMQHLRYVVIRTPELVKKVFSLTGWGGTVKPKRNPELGKSAPLAFIAVTAASETVKTLRHIHADAGAAIQNMLLKAVDLGLGTCWIGNFKEENVSPVIGLDAQMKTLYLIAVGYPDESPVQIDIGAGESNKYFLDDKDVIHVPKFKPEAISEWK